MTSTLRHEPREELSVQLYWDNGELGFKDGPVKQWVRKHCGDRKSFCTGFASAKAITLAMLVFVIMALGGGAAAAALSNTDTSAWIVAALVVVSLIGWTIVILMWLGQHWNGEVYKVAKHTRIVHGRVPDPSLDAIPATQGVDSFICWGDSAAEHVAHMRTLHI